MTTIFNLLAIVAFALGGPKEIKVDPDVASYLDRLESYRSGAKVELLGTLFTENFESTVTEVDGKSVKSNWTRKDYTAAHKKLITSVQDYKYSHEVADSRKLKDGRTYVRIVSRWSFILNEKKVDMSSTEEFFLEKVNGEYQASETTLRY